MPPLYSVFLISGLFAFALGALEWSNRRQDWRDAFGLGLSAGGLVLIVAGCAMAPGWS